MEDTAYEQFPPPFEAPMDLDLLESELKTLFVLAKEGKPDVRFYPDYREIPGILKYYANKGELDDYELCRAPWTNIRVAPNGDVYPCLAYKMGNITDESLRSVWRSENMNRFRSELEDRLMPACLGCCFLKAKPGVQFDGCGNGAAESELLSIKSPQLQVD